MTPTAKTLADLRGRLEAATGPDRELDGAIAIELAGWTFQKMKGDFLPYWRKPGETEYWKRDALPPYTASIDVTVALIERLLPKANRAITIWETPEGETRAMGAVNAFVVSSAPTAPLALLLALVSALQAQIGEQS